MNRQEVILFEEFLKEEDAYEKFLKTLEEENGTDLKQYYQESNTYFIISSAFRWGGYRTFNQESHDYWKKLNMAWRKRLNNFEAEELQRLIENDEVKAELPKNMVSEEISKEIAYFVAFFYWGDYGFGSMFETFDKVYEMAVNFVEKYPPTLDWEEESWEEVAEQWIMANYKNIKLN